MRCVPGVLIGTPISVRTFRLLSPSSAVRVATELLPNPLRVHTLNTPLMTGSVLHPSGSERLLRPLLQSASPSRDLTASICTRQANRLPRVIRVTFPAYIRRIYVLTFRIGIGL